VTTAGAVGGGRPARVRRVRRAPVLVALAALAVAAMVAGSGSERAARTVVGPNEPVAMPPDDARSIAWYCAGGPVALRDTGDGTELAAGDDVILAGNLSDETQPIRITAMADGEIVGVSRRQVPPHATLAVPVRDLTDAAKPGVVVETFSGLVAIEHAVRGSELAVGPCSTEPAPRWFLPGGTTVAGARQWLTLFNPFGDDAIVNVAFDTTSGRREPAPVSALVVPRRTRITIPVHDQVFREEMVATTVTARAGRVIAEQSVDFVEGRSGTTLSLGAVATAPTWVMATGQPGDGVSRRLVVMNPGDVDVEIDVRGLASADEIIEPRTEVVPRRSTSEIDVSGLASAPYGLVVDTGSRRGVVVGDLATWDGVGVGRDTATGATATLGSARPSDRFVFASARPAGQPRLRLAVANPGLESVTVSVELHTAGTVERPDPGQGVVVGPGRSATIRLPAPPDDGAVVLTATGDVLAERLVVGRDGSVSVSAGIPPTPRIAPFAGTTSTATTTTGTTVPPATTTTVPPATTTATTAETATTRPPRRTTTTTVRGDATTTTRGGSGGGRRTTTTSTTAP
jgi:hypothetical protein